MACFENRVKNSLAYLSAFDSKSTELVRLSPGASLSKPRCIQKLLARIRTFSQMTWFAKPDWLSPVNCARLGWQNVDVDLLACSKCKAVISAKLPSSQNIQVYDECCKRLESLLQNGHHNCCSRRSQPMSSDLCRLTLQSRSVELQEFISRVKGLIELKSHLQIFEQSAFASLKLTTDDVVALCQLAADFYPHFVGVDRSVLMSACILALCGWNVSTSASCGELVECTFCNRKVGLWNYFSQNPDFDEEATTAMSGYYDDDDLAANGNEEADFGVVVCNSIVVAEETDVQPMNEDQELLHGEGTDGGVTGVEMEQSVVLTEGKIPDLYQSPEDNNEEQEPAGNVLLQFPHEIQTGVSHEALVADGLFGGTENEQLPDDEGTMPEQLLSGIVLDTTDVFKTANSFCDAETLVVDEGTTLQTTGEDGGRLTNQEAAALCDAEIGVKRPNDGGKKSQDEDDLGDVEITQEECAMADLAPEEESAGVNLVHGFDVVTDLSGTCDAIDSGDNVSTSAVLPAQHNLGDGDGGRDGDSCNRSDEIGVDAEIEGQQGLAKATNAVASETFPSVSDDITPAADDEVTDGVNTVGVSDENSGGQEVQMNVEDGFNSGAAAEDGNLEQRSNNICEKPVDSNDDATCLNSTEGYLCQPTDNNDLSTDELRHQQIAQVANTPGQPVTKPPDELTDELTEQLTPQSAVQNGELTAKQFDEVNNQATEEQLSDQATVTHVVESEANDERDAEPHCRESTKRRTTTATPEELKNSAKRRRLARPVRVHFDPVAEHRPWCIWVQDLVVKRRPRMSDGNMEKLKDVASCSVPQHPWIRLFHLLLQPSPPEKRDVRRALSVIKSF